MKVMTLYNRHAPIIPDTNMFCADALEQISITAPNHATLLNNRPARPRADLNLVSVSFVFKVDPLFFVFCFLFGLLGPEKWRPFPRNPYLTRRPRGGDETA